MAEEIWAQTFKYLADNKVLFEGMLLKPSMVTPGADSGKKVLFVLLLLPLCCLLPAACRLAGSWFLLHVHCLRVVLCIAVSHIAVYD